MPRVREWPSTVAKRRRGAGSVSYLQLQAPQVNMPSKPEQAETGNGTSAVCGE